MQRRYLPAALRVRELADTTHRCFIGVLTSDGYGIDLCRTCTGVNSEFTLTRYPPALNLFISHGTAAHYFQQAVYYVILKCCSSAPSFGATFS
ncbi:MAG: hypothetical protein ACYCY0_04305 [Acidithiobacillus ferrivorans]